MGNPKHVPQLLLILIRKIQLNMLLMFEFYSSYKTGYTLLGGLIGNAVVSINLYFCQASVSWISHVFIDTSTMKWVCLKIVYPYTQWLMIIIPTKWL